MGVEDGWLYSRFLPWSLNVCVDLSGGLLVFARERTLQLMHTCLPPVWLMRYSYVIRTWGVGVREGGKKRVARGLGHLVWTHMNNQ